MCTRNTCLLPFDFFKTWLDRNRLFNVVEHVSYKYVSRILSLYAKSSNMKNSEKHYTNYLLFALTLSILGGCGGYAKSSSSASGAQVYGTVDVGVSHESR